LSNLTRITALRLDLAPAGLSDTIDVAPESLRNPTQRRLASATQLVFVGPHAHCDTALAGRDLAAEIVKVGSASTLDCFDRLSHAISDSGSGWILGPLARHGLFAASSGRGRLTIFPICYSLTQ
jgi:hypothetical protein